jgi:hypothetical protein
MPTSTGAAQQQPLRRALWAADARVAPLREAGTPAEWPTATPLNKGLLQRRSKSRAARATTNRPSNAAESVRVLSASTKQRQCCGDEERDDGRRGSGVSGMTHRRHHRRRHRHCHRHRRRRRHHHRRSDARDPARPTPIPPKGLRNARQSACASAYATCASNAKTKTTTDVHATSEALAHVWRSRAVWTTQQTAGRERATATHVHTLCDRLRREQRARARAHAHDPDRTGRRRARQSTRWQTAARTAPAPVPPLQAQRMRAGEAAPAVVRTAVPVALQS